MAEMAENHEVKEIESLTVSEFCEFLETNFDQEGVTQQGKSHAPK